MGLNMRKQSQTETEVKTAAWSSFYPYFAKQWRQGEHVSTIGQTGSGKSYLNLRIIALRKYYILFLTKGNDTTLDTFIARNDIEVIETWPPTGYNDHIALWPRFRGLSSFAAQQLAFKRAINGYRNRFKRKIDGIYTEGGWSVLVDEVSYFTDQLKLDSELAMLWTQGRSNNISLVASTQRPRDVPQLMFNQWSHLFVFQTTDDYELKRIASIGGNNSRIVLEKVPYLPQYHFLYLNRRGTAIISKVEQ